MDEVVKTEKPATLLLEHRPIDSSNLRSVGYAPETQTLEVVFSGGGVYRYKAVPRETYEALLKAPSKGSFFHREIKAKFEFVSAGVLPDKKDKKDEKTLVQPVTTAAA